MSGNHYLEKVWRFIKLVFGFDGTFGMKSYERSSGGSSASKEEKLRFAKVTISIMLNIVKTRIIVPMSLHFRFD